MTNDDLDIVTKIQLLKEFLEKSGEASKYCTLLKDDEGLYLKYTFLSGTPENNRNLPVWVGELEINRCYKIGNYNDTYWYINDTTPIDLNKLFEETKFEATIPEMLQLANTEVRD